MERHEKLARLQSMLSQVDPAGELAAPSRLKALPGAADPRSTTRAAVMKITRDRAQDLTESEIYHLEAIVMPRERPVVFVRGGMYDDVAAPWTHLNAPATKARFQPLLRSVGRIEVPGAPWYPYGGTGFLVGPNLVMTNRHVAALVTEGAGTRLRYQPGDAAVDLLCEVDTPPAERAAYFTVRSVVMLHPFWDMALLETDGLDGFAPLRLSTTPPEELTGREVLAVGYPARDDRNDLALQDQIFARKYNVKRVQPGKLRPRATIRSFQNTVNALTHDSSTLGGNSGSAILDLVTGEVLGLHFAGEYLKANYAVPLFELARDVRVASRGLNFAGTVAPTNDWEPLWQRANAVEVTPPPAAATAPASAPAASDTVTLTVPLTITLSLGRAPGISLAAPAEAFPLALPKIYGSLERRKGYQASFLDGETVPLPTLTSLGTSVVATLADGSSELRYHKFSVVMHKGRRLALFTAANVDWRLENRLIEGRKPTRRELTEIPDGAIEQWATDWRIPEEHQLPDLFYSRDDGAFDKGHLVRRDDVCWGKPFRDMQKANGDTYHTTNCSPQVAAFNRSKASDDINNWGDLESLVQKQTSAQRAIIFAGPVFEEDDPLFKGRDSRGRTFVRIPRSYWKIIVVKGAAGPEAYGFVLQQDLSALPVEEKLAIPARWRREMRSIAQIEALFYGLAELPWLRQHDQFASPEAVRLAESVSA